MRATLFAAAVLALLVAAPSAHAEFYKWTDDHGQIHLSDDYYKVPPKYRSKVEVKKPVERDSGVGAPPPLGEVGQQGPTGPTNSQPTLPTGDGSPAAWQDWNGRGADYWLSRQRDLQGKAKDLERRIRANKETIAGLRSTRAAYMGGRRQRAGLEAENKELEMELAELRKMLTSGLATEALRAGVPADFASSLRGM